MGDASLSKIRIWWKFLEAILWAEWCGLQLFIFDLDFDFFWILFDRFCLYKECRRITWPHRQIHLSFLLWCWYQFLKILDCVWYWYCNLWFNLNVKESCNWTLLLIDRKWPSSTCCARELHIKLFVESSTGIGITLISPVYTDRTCRRNWLFCFIDKWPHWVQI